MNVKAVIMNEETVGRTIARLSHEILEKFNGAKDVALIGIRTRGVPLAKRIAATIKKFEGKSVLVGVLDITLYRDDFEILSDHPKIKSSDIAFSLEGKNVVLVDDVLYTGRTIRAALDAISDMGRPKQVSLAVLVDRGHRELPIRADFVGKNLPTSGDEVVSVSLNETDGEDSVKLFS
jgi:pyrimidine operon attenuation protein/uracil phosphoribosyltransferase